jgi:hypothetical protein
VNDCISEVAKAAKNHIPGREYECEVMTIQKNERPVCHGSQGRLTPLIAIVVPLSKNESSRKIGACIQK